MLFGHCGVNFSGIVARLQSHTCWLAMLWTSLAMYLNQPPSVKYLEVDSSVITCLFYRAAALFVQWLRANGSRSFSLFSFWLVWNLSGGDCGDPPPPHTLFDVVYLFLPELTSDELNMKKEVILLSELLDSTQTFVGLNLSADLSVGLLSDVISIVLGRNTVTVHCNFPPSVIARIALFWHTVRRTACESFAAVLHWVNCKRLVQEAKQWRVRRNHEFLSFLYSLLRCDLFSLLLWRHYGKYI